jgi:hypothetical protein
MTGDPPPDPHVSPSYLPVTRRKLTEASLRAAGKGASAVGRASDLVRRKLDERSAQQAAPPPVTPPYHAQVAPFVPTQVAPPVPAPPAPIPAPSAPMASAMPMAQPAPGYPPVPYPPRAEPARPAKVNAAAVVAIVVAVIFPPAGLGLARSARRECRETGEAGANLALVAHVIAAAGTTLLVLTVLAVASAFAIGIYKLGSGVAGIGSFLSWIQRLFS